MLDLVNLSGLYRRFGVVFLMVFFVLVFGAFVLCVIPRI
jgi:hypothetical protein